MVTETLRYVLAAVLLVTMAGIAGRASLGAAAQGGFPLPGVSLCIHR